MVLVICAESYHTMGQNATESRLAAVAAEQ
jgi:hypothetical protein